MNGKRSVSFLISLILAFILAGGVSAVVFSDDDYINNNQCVLSDPDLNDWSDVLVCKIGQWIGEVAKISELTEEGVIIMADNGEFSDRLGYEEKFIFESINKGNMLQLTAGEISEEDGGLTIVVAIEEVENSAVVASKDSFCNGCFINDKCYNFGYRKSGDFCSDSLGWTPQLADEAVCENNFECSSNFCVDSACVSSTMWQKILAWFKRIF